MLFYAYTKYIILLFSVEYIMSSTINATPEESILRDIKQLQVLEKELFTNLEQNTSLSAGEQDKIFDKINKVTAMRLDLYQTLNEINKFYKNSLDNSNITLREQKQAVAILEDNLNKSKKEKEKLARDKNNKIRLIEINNYYGDRYEEHAQLLKIVVFSLIPIVVLSLLRRFIPDMLYYGLIAFILLISGYYFIVRLWSIINRDDMNYDEYNWNFNPSSAPGPPSKDVTPIVEPRLATGNWGMCMGSACCSDGQEYNEDLNLCVISQPNEQ